MERLEREKDELLSHYFRILPEGLDTLEPEDRNRIYKMLDLSVRAQKDGSLKLTWVLDACRWRDNEPPPPGSFRTRGR
jgi:hypothetical protein